MRRLAIWVQESAKGPEPTDDLGTLYREPFAAALSMWTFSARVLAALCNHAWQSTPDENRLVLIFTPALPAGRSQVIDDLDGYRSVSVGVDPDGWNTAPPAAQRRLLIEIAVRELEPVRERWGLDWAALQRAARDLIEDDPNDITSVGEASPIALGAALAPLLDVDTWQRWRGAIRPILWLMT